MFTATSFIITPNLENPKWSLIDEQVNKMWHIHTIEYYSVISKNALLKQHSNTYESQSHAE